jgi:hypothetical protein
MSLLADIIRDHVGISTTREGVAILAAVNACETRVRPADADAADAVELAIVIALNAGIPLKHSDAFRALRERHTTD